MARVWAIPMYALFQRHIWKRKGRVTFQLCPDGAYEVGGFGSDDPFRIEGSKTYFNRKEKVLKVTDVYPTEAYPLRERPAEPNHDPSDE